MAISYRDSSHVILKLDGGSNYEAWQRLVSTSLASSGVGKFTEDTAIPPTNEVDEKDYHSEARQAYNAQAAHSLSPPGNHIFRPR